MKRNDKVLAYALGISVAIHLVAIGVIGHTSAMHMSEASVSDPAHLIDVSLVDPNKPLPAKHSVIHQLTANLVKKYVNLSGQNKAVPVLQNMPSSPAHANISPSQMKPVRMSSAPNHAGGNPGGKLNIGSLSVHGDLGGAWQSGRTPMGWVPGSENGRGEGSGDGRGVGRPEPVKNADEGHANHPAQASIAPAVQEPRRVTVRICNVSGMLAGEYCTSTRRETFIEGREPKSKCNKCHAPEQRSRLADQEKPVLIHDSRVSIPASVDEGLSLSATAEYTVNAEGSVTGIEIVKSSGIRAVDRAVTSAVSELKYKPAVSDGAAHSVKMNRTYKVNT